MIALLLIGLLGWGVSVALSALNSDQTEQEAASTEQPQQSGTTQVPTDEEESDGMCEAGQIEIIASTDQNSYTADKSPALIMEIKNSSDSECKLNVGTSQQEFMVMSGSDRIFSTADCAENGEDVTLDFKPGQQESARFSWQRERSAPGCKPVDVQPRPGTYRFTAILGELESEATSFELK